MELVKIELTIDQVNRLLNILGELPHNKVHEFMFTIYQQGTSQVSTHRPEEHVQWMSPNVNSVDFEEELAGLS
jgi:hypothetical protein